MNSNNNKKIRVAGILTLIGLLAGILSVSPAVDSPHYLSETSNNANQVIFAAIFQFVLSLTYIGFVILIYPIIKSFGNSLALGFLCFRVLAVGVSVIGTIVMLALLNLSDMFIQNTGQDQAMFTTIGDVLKSCRDVINHIFMVLLLCCGNILLYISFYKARLVPIWIPVWGMGAATLSIFASGLIMFQVVEIITPTYLILNTPTALFELLLGIWLIKNGFNKDRISAI